MRTADDALAVVMKRKVIVDLPAPNPTPKTPTGRVVGAQTLNIRSGPGTAFPVIGAARAGDEGEIVGRSADGRWWAVSAPSLPGGIGWVSADFVLATNAENVPVIASPPPPTPRPPTPTPVPTARPTAAPPPPPTAMPEISFWADRTSIAKVNALRSTGRCKMSRQCGSIHWASPTTASHARDRAAKSSARQARRPTRCGCCCAMARPSSDRSPSMWQRRRLLAPPPPAADPAGGNALGCGQREHRPGHRHVAPGHQRHP